MRCLWLVLALAACGHPSAHGPAWPAPSTTADDGGESIAPRESSKVAAAIEKADGETAAPLVPAVTVPPATPSETAPATAPAATPPQVEDIFINEDIIIEIDD